MQVNTRNAVLAATALVALANIVLGCVLPQPLLGAGGALGLVYVFARMKGSGRRKRWRGATANPAASVDVLSSVPAGRPVAVDPSDTATLVETMLAQGRSALLLRPQIAGNLNEEQFRRALEALAEEMALVPEGEVVLGQIDEADDYGRLDAEEIAACQGRVVRVEPFFLDRYPVTNRQFCEFVAAGGYQQASLWDPAILPAVLDFVDRTGFPGPRFWKGGCYEADKADHPVVGVSWHEAAAFARWVGKRLATDAEWVKAGSWPVSVSPTSRVQRRYPWGNTMDRARANLWGSGMKGTVPVTDYPDGISVGGVYQLIGNVWEWMRGNFAPRDTADEQWVFETPMKSIRGGAFDTYFDSQATCQFQSGDEATARKHNIGFRCAVGVCDLALSRSHENASATAEQETRTEQEVPA